MTIRKFGTGEVLPEKSDDAKTAAANYTDEDRAALAEENATADRDDDGG